MKIQLFAYLCLCAIAFTFSAQAQDADEIINNYFEKTGGIDQWENLKTIKMEGEVPTPQGDYTFVIYKKEPNLTKLEVDVNGQMMVPQAYDGQVAWTINPFQGSTAAQKMPDEVAKVIADGAEFEDPLLNYQEKGHTATFEGEETVDSVATYKVKLVKNADNPQDSASATYHFDQQTYLPVLIKNTINVGPMAGQESETYLSDYQKTDGGPMMPYMIETRMGDQSVEKVKINTIVVNEDINDSVFAFPAPDDTAVEPDTTNSGGGE